MDVRHPNTLVHAVASTSYNASEELAEYPDPKNFNLNDTHDQDVFLHQYEVAQQHDPQVKFAVLIFYLILLTMIVAQSSLFYWKKLHKRSYELVTLLGLWLVPAVISFHFHFWRFLLVWAIFTITSGYMFFLCSAKRLERTTPRRVYTWFLGVYNVSVGMGLLGYGLLILSLFGASAGGRPLLPGGAAVVMLWYGLYFGVLGRDAAEVAADRMAAMIGTRRQMAVSVRSCGVCGGELGDFGAHIGAASGVVSAGEEAAEAMQQRPVAGWGREQTVQLACKHVFHDLCIRGWAIVGKKDTCPTCLEKVDLRSVFADRPWETRNLTWIQMLDGVRYLVVWNPLILLAMHFFMHWFGLDRFTEARHKGDREALMLMSRARHQHMAGMYGYNATNGTHPVW